jgi:hypothetical protein
MLACYALLTPGGKDDAEIISESLELKNVRERAAPEAYGHVDNALTTGPQANQKHQTEPWRLDIGQPADGLPP